MCLSLLFRLLALSLLLAATGSAATGTRAFVERVQPENYYAAEKLLPEPFSQSHDVVILRITAGTPVSVFALHPAPNGEDYLLTLQLASTAGTGEWLKITEELESTLGQQVVRAIEFKLHRQVMLAKFRRSPSKTDSDLWVYQKLSDGRVATAVIAMEDTLENPEATTFIDGLLGGLQQLIGKDGVERKALLQRIDRIAIDIILAGAH